MFGNFVIAAVVRMSGNGVTYMQRLSSQATLANASLARQQKQITANQLAMIRYKEKIDAVRAAQMRMAVTAAGYGAVAGFAFLATAATDAAKLQTVMVGVQNATGATNAQMEKLRQNAFNLGDRTGMSVLDAAKVMAIIARSSGGVFTNAKGAFDMSSFQSFMPKIAEFAAVQHARPGGLSLDNATETGIKLAHMFRQFSGNGAEKMFDQMTRLSELMPDNLGKALTQFGYFLPQFKSLGISDENSVATMALLDRVGYGRNKGGTSIANLVLSALGPLQMTQHAQAGKLDVLKEIGVLDSHGQSKFFTNKGANLFGFLEQLAQFAAKHGRMTTVKDFESAFGKQGGRIANLAIDPVFVKSLKGIVAFMGRTDISQGEQFKKYQGTLGFQFGRAVANFSSVMTELGWPWLSSLTSMFKSLGDNLHSLQAWLHTHKAAEKQIGMLVIGMTGIFTGFVAFAGALQLNKLLGLGKAFNALKGVVPGIFDAIGSIGEAITGLAARIMGSPILRFLTGGIGGGITGGIGMALLPIPAADGGLSPSERAREASANARYRNSGGPRVQIHGDLHVHVSGGTAGYNQLMHALDNPQSHMRTAGVQRTHPSLPLSFAPR